MSFRHPSRAARLAALGLVAPLALLAAPHAAYAVGTADGNIPIGTTTIPTSEFGVYGGATVGTSYMSTAAPTNGLLVQGNVGIGTTSPGANLQIGTTTKLNPSHTPSDSTGSYLFDTNVADPSVNPTHYIALFNNGGSNVAAVSTTSIELLGASSIANHGGNATFTRANVGYLMSLSNTLGPALIVPSGNVGIGTTSPLSILSVAGNLALGAYGGGASTTAAPSNGLIVSGQSGIGTAAPNAAALLDAFSTTQGLLPPRVTAAQEVAIGTNVSSGGLLVYNTTLNELDVYNSATQQWEAVGANAADAAGSTGQVQFNSGGDLGASANFFWDNTHNRLGIGTSTMASTFEVNGNESIGYPDTAAPTNGLLVQGNVGIGTTSSAYPLAVVGNLGVLNASGTQIFSVQPGSSLLTLRGSAASDAITGPRILFNQGASATVPAYTFTSNTAVGINSSATNVLNFITNSLTRLYIDSSGNVGIGTTTPQNLLDVNGAASVGYNVAAPSNGLIVSGQTGIGTTAPNAAALLDVFSTTQGILPPRVTAAQETAIGTNVSSGGLLVYNTTLNELDVYDSATGQWEAVGANAADAAGSTGQVQFNSGGDLGASANFFWDNTHNRLGIGTSTMASTFEVNGNESIGYVDTAAPTNGLLVKGNVGIGTTAPQTGLHYYGGASGKAYPSFAAAGGALVETSSAGPSEAFGVQTAGGYGLSVLNNANVGIGTTAPQTGLHVWGGASGKSYPTFVGDGVLIESASQNSGNVQFGTLTGSGPGLMVMGNGSVGIGTTTPIATLDVNGYAHLAKNSSQPIACDAAHDGSLALASTRRPCECVSSAWIDVVYGTACSW